LAQAAHPHINASVIGWCKPALHSTQPFATDDEALLPTLQVWHLTPGFVDDGWYLPCVHATHSSSGEMNWKPVGQNEHDDACIVLEGCILPVKHEIHGEEGEEGEALPLSQLLHLTPATALLSWYKPDAHETHGVLVVVNEKPAAQKEHDVEPAFSEYFPTMHGLQESKSLAPDSAFDVPLGH
jgi:hypothetical protein|tara:strand:+ start:106 stop:654 length:549 start_codon:yes stop_codon:yes gene_type:complete